MLQDEKDISYLKGLCIKSPKDLQQEGWKPVASPTDTHGVYQRPDKSNSSLAQYLVIARLKNISARAALFANINAPLRRQWDMVGALL